MKEFYSWYFANDAEKRNKSPEMFDKYVAPGTRPTTNSDVDPFVLTSDFPKAFRVGECTVIEPGKRVRFELLLFWKDDKRSEQRSIHLDVDKVDGKWMIKAVTP